MLDTPWGENNLPRAQGCPGSSASCAEHHPGTLKVTCWGQHPGFSHLCQAVDPLGRHWSQPKALPKAVGLLPILHPISTREGQCHVQTPILGPNHFAACTWAILILRVLTKGTSPKHLEALQDTALHALLIPCPTHACLGQTHIDLRVLHRCGALGGDGWCSPNVM